jgi:hypothetical protein
MSAYDKARSQQKTAEGHYATTKARIEKIQSQLDNSARGDKLRGKVCIITGVGSLKGIGYVESIGLFHLISIFCRRATSILFAHEGQNTVRNVAVLLTFSQARNTCISLTLIPQIYPTSNLLLKRDIQM